jgi:HK97 gp10 family phage protein
MKIHVQVHGIPELTRKLAPAQLAGPQRRFLDRASIALQNQARGLAPVDTGRLRNSIGREIDRGIPPRYARVGTNTFYAPFVHEGTRPHWPPIAPLRRWAKRHGVNPYALQRAIATRGTRPRPFLRDAVAEAQPEIEAAVGWFAYDIEQTLGGG